jgi:hypothetical protein
MLSTSAPLGGKKELDEKATFRLVKAGEGSPEYHLFIGKAHLNLERIRPALADFKAAAEEILKHRQRAPCRTPDASRERHGTFT